MHVVWWTGVSMDGRIASAVESLDFLDTIGARDDGDDEFGALIASVDAVLVGAGTLRWLVRGGHGWPHDDLPTWLISHDEALADSVRPTRAELLRREDVGAALDEIEAAGYERVWLAGGGAVAAQALALDRLDEVLVTVAPVAVGAGPALFDADDLPLRPFELVECKAVGGGAARLRWLRRRP